MVSYLQKRLIEDIARPVKGCIRHESHFCSGYIRNVETLHRNLASRTEIEIHFRNCEHNSAEQHLDLATRKQVWSF